MNRINKFLSLLLIVSLLFSFVPVARAADSETSHTDDTAFELPDIIDPLEAEENGYTERVPEEEKI